MMRCFVNCVENEEDCYTCEHVTVCLLNAIEILIKKVERLEDKIEEL